MYLFWIGLKLYVDESQQRASNSSCGHRSHRGRTAKQGFTAIHLPMSSNIRRTPTPQSRDQYAQVPQQSSSYLPRRATSSSGRRTPQPYLSPPSSTLYGPRQPQYNPLPLPVPTPPQPPANYVPFANPNDTRQSRPSKLNRSDTVHSVARHAIGGGLGPYAVIALFFFSLSLNSHRPSASSQRYLRR